MAHRPSMFDKDWVGEATFRLKRSREDTPIVQNQFDDAPDEEKEQQGDPQPQEEAPAVAAAAAAARVEERKATKKGASTWSSGLWGMGAIKQLASALGRTKVIGKALAIWGSAEEQKDVKDEPSEEVEERPSKRPRTTTEGEDNQVEQRKQPAPMAVLEGSEDSSMPKATTQDSQAFPVEPAPLADPQKKTSGSNTNYNNDVEETPVPRCSKTAPFQTSQPGMPGAPEGAPTVTDNKSAPGPKIVEKSCEISDDAAVEEKEEAQEAKKKKNAPATTREASQEAKASPRLRSGKKKEAIPVTKGRRLSSPKPPSKKRCGNCEGCLRDDCGECQECIHKRKFGGDGTSKQACMHRRCLVIKGVKHKSTTFRTPTPKVSHPDGDKKCPEGDPTTVGRSKKRGKRGSFSKEAQEDVPDEDLFDFDDERKPPATKAKPEQVAQMEVDQDESPPPTGNGNAVPSAASMPTAEHAAEETTSTSAEDEAAKDLRVSNFFELPEMAETRAKMSDYNQLLLEHFECFRAKEKDIASCRKRGNGITCGSIGIRCRHCGYSRFPGRIDLLSIHFYTMTEDHFPNKCPNLSEEKKHAIIEAKLLHADQTKERGGVNIQGDFFKKLVPLCGMTNTQYRVRLEVDVGAEERDYKTPAPTPRKSRRSVTKPKASKSERKQNRKPATKEAVGDGDDSDASSSESFREIFSRLAQKDETSFLEQSDGSVSVIENDWDTNSDDDTKEVAKKGGAHAGVKLAGNKQQRLELHEELAKKAKSKQTKTKKQQPSSTAEPESGGIGPDLLAALNAPQPTTGAWTLNQQLLFNWFLKTKGYGKWHEMHTFMPSRTATQHKSHGQKVMKSQRDGVDIFEILKEHPERLKLLLARARAKGSSAEESEMEEEEEADEAVAAASPKKRGPGRSRKHPIAEEAAAAAQKRGPSNNTAAGQQRGSSTRRRNKGIVCGLCNKKIESLTMWTLMCDEKVQTHIREHVVCTNCYPLSHLGEDESTQPPMPSEAENEEDWEYRICSKHEYNRYSPWYWNQAGAPI